MSEPAAIVVPERGQTMVSAVEWRRIDASAAFWFLVNAGILEARRLPDGCAALMGTRYVGIAALDAHTTIQVQEKIPGALAALVSFASGRNFRVERIPAPAADLFRLAALLVHEFVKAARAYVSIGREFRYGFTVERSAFVRGRLRMIKTIQLRARGLGHLVAFERPTRDFRTPFNLVVFAAVKEIEKLSRLVAIDDDDVAASRALALLFADCHTPEVLVERRTNWASRAAALATSNVNPRQVDLLLLASVLLARQGFDLEGHRPGTVPRSWFLNLETLFENAVRRVLADLLRPLTVVHGRARSIFVFADRQRLKAEPDIVIERMGDPIVVGDVKYKELSGSPEPSDIYQLFAHAQAYGASAAFLVYPGDRFEVTKLGTIVGDVGVTVVKVDVRELPRDLSKAASALGLLA